MALQKKAEVQSSPELDRRLTRNPCLTIIHCGDDEVVVKHSSRSRFTKDIRDAGRTKMLGKILRNVVPPASLAELKERGVIGEDEVEDSLTLVQYLREQGVLVDPEADPTRVYLDTVIGGGTDFSTLKVGMIGAGYLGSRIACQLSRLGIGTLVALDHRRVERQAMDRAYFDLAHDMVQAGKPYVDCLRDQLVSWGHDPKRIETIDAGLDDEEAVGKLVSECDFMVTALEVYSARTLHLANTVAIEHEKPWISVLVDGSEALVGPLYVPGESCCYNEFEIQHEATLGALKDSYLIYKEAQNAGEIDGSHFALPPYLSVASGLAVTGIMHFLLSGRSYLLGRCNRLDFERLSIDYEEVMRLPRCPACAPSRPGYRNLFM